MFDAEDIEQNELDYDYVESLRDALRTAIAEADRLHDELRGNGQAPNLEKGRRLLRALMRDI